MLEPRAPRQHPDQGSWAKPGAPADIKIPSTACGRDTFAGSPDFPTLLQASSGRRSISARVAVYRGGACRRRRLTRRSFLQVTGLLQCSAYCGPGIQTPVMLRATRSALPASDGRGDGWPTIRASAGIGRTRWTLRKNPMLSGVRSFGFIRRAGGTAETELSEGSQQDENGERGHDDSINDDTLERVLRPARCRRGR